ncbi:MAG: hypothetical protein EHJ95_06655 [Methanobacteriota archaeon]|nr:MAG: hypothetical protein EHJ95_06655 [Euryarchaeota archaeon]
MCWNCRNRSISCDSYSNNFCSNCH